MYFIRFYNRLALWKKSLCLGLLCLVVIALATRLYINEVRKVIALSQLEQQGLTPVQLMLTIIQRTQQHSGLSALYLSDPKLVKKERREKAEDVERAINNFEAFARKNATGNIIAAVNEQTLYWHTISPHLTLRDISLEQNIQFHAALLHMQLNILHMIVDRYQLNLDPQANGHFLISASLIAIPELTDALNKMRAKGIQLLIQGEATFFERVDIKSLLLFSTSKVTEVDERIKKAAATSTNQLGIILGQYDQTKEQYQKYILLTQSEILNLEKFSYDATAYYFQTTDSINAYFSYATFSIEQINNILQDRIDKTQREMIYSLFFVFAITFFVTFICFHFMRKLLMQLGSEAT